MHATTGPKGLETYDWAKAAGLSGFETSGIDAIPPLEKQALASSGLKVLLLSIIPRTLATRISPSTSLDKNPRFEFVGG